MRKIVANISWIFFDKLFRMATGILVGIWVARYLGPSDFGLLNYAILFPTVFASFASFGLTNILMIEYVEAGEDAQQKHQLLSTGLVIKLVMGVFTYALTLGLNYYLNKDNPLLFLLINITGSVLIFQSSDVVDTYFQSQTKAKLSVIVKLITFSLAAGVRVYGLYAQYGIVFFAVINLVESFLAYGLILGVYQSYSGKLINTIFRVVDKNLIFKLVRIGWPLMFTEFFVYVYMRVDQFMIESLSTNKELGLYGAALRLSESWYFVAIAICSSIYPKIAELWNVDKEKFYERYESMLNILVYISVFLSIFVSIFAEQLISLLYGADYKGAGNVLSIHIWAGIFVFIGVGINNLMLLENLQKFVLIKTIIAALINVALNFWLIPAYGAVGASLATLFSYSLSSYGMNFLYTPSRFVFFLQTKSFINLLTFKNPINSSRSLIQNGTLVK